MICPVCAAEGLKSTVVSGGVARTLLGWAAYFDEAGVRHVHDPNKNREIYDCSNGHVFEREFRQPCPVGDYPGPDSEKITVRPDIAARRRSEIGKSR